MKTYYPRIFAVLIALTLCFCMYAKTDDEDGEPIPLEYNEPGEDGKPIIRGPLMLPVSAFYIEENACVGVSFISDLGSVTISLTNLTTMINANTIVNSSCGYCYIPITGGPGFYCIEFLTEDGARYYGYFSFT